MLLNHSVLSVPLGLHKGIVGHDNIMDRKNFTLLKYFEVSLMKYVYFCVIRPNWFAYLDQTTTTTIEHEL